MHTEDDSPSSSYPTTPSAVRRSIEQFVLDNTQTRIEAPIELRPPPKCQWIVRSRLESAFSHPCKRAASYRIQQGHFTYSMCVDCAHRVILSTSGHLSAEEILGTTDEGDLVIGKVIHRPRAQW